MKGEPHCQACLCAGRIVAGRGSVGGSKDERRIFAQGELAMNTGRFKLDKTTLAIGDLNGKLVSVTIPAGDIVELVTSPSPGDQIVDVLWEGRMVAMYAIDLRLRGVATA